MELSLDGDDPKASGDITIDHFFDIGQGAMSFSINNSEIRQAFGTTTFNRGARYFKEGRLLALEVIKEEDSVVELEASVEGSGGRVYDQRVCLKRHFTYLSLDGDCTCPVGYNCKHVVTACLGFQTRTLGRKRLTREWLESLRKPAAGEEGLRSGRSYLFYVLRFPLMERTPMVDLMVARVKKDGTLGVAKKAASVLNDFGYGYYRTPDYVQAVDKSVLGLLERLWKDYRQLQLRGGLGFSALEKMLATGRCCLESVDRPLRFTGESRRLRLGWEAVKEGYQLLPRVESRGRWINTQPSCWLDPDTGEVGLLNVSGLEGLNLEHLETTPVLPAEEVGPFTIALLMDFPELPIPPPVPVEIEDVEGKAPTPVLKLELRGKDRESYCARLEFDYGICRGAHGSKAVEILQGVGGLIRLRRDTETEQTAVGRLGEMGFVENGAAGGYVPGEECGGGWRRFLEEDVPRLEEDGWRIERSGDFRPSFFDDGDLQAEVGEDEEGWFDLRFDLDIEGQKLPLLPLLVPLLQRYDDPGQLPDELTVELGGQRFLTLSSERLRPFLETLFELFDSDYAEDSLRLSRFDAARLVELEEDARLQMKGAEQLRRLGRRLRDFQRVETVAPPEGLNCQLRPYQQFGLNWLQFLREYELGGILADDMGLGKTVQTLAHLLLEKEAGRLERPALVVAPTSLMGNWRREAGRFAPDLRGLVLHGPERQEHFGRIGEHDLVLTTYPLLVRDEETLKSADWSFLILDEAQTVKNPRTKAARVLRRLRAGHRLCLTGTPLENHLGELWALFDFLMPGFLGSEEKFKRLYRTPVEKHGDEDCRRRLVRRIAPFMLRRSKSEVEKDLPPKTEMVRTVELYPNQAALYENIRVAMEHKVREAVAAKGLARSQIAILDALLKLRQVCCHPRLVKLSKAGNVPSAKLDLLLQMLPELLEEGRKILLFSQFTSMLNLIEKEVAKKKIAYAKLTGQTRKRDEAIGRFKSGEANLFLISLKAGGVGLNLTEADTVILYDPWWNPAVEAQAMDRAHRIGQDKPVFVYKLMSENTVEERILKLQARKQALAEGIYGKAGKKGPAISADDLQDLFAPLE